MDGEDTRTIWCGNLNEKVTEDLLYELFLQGGPVERVVIPKDRQGKPRAYAFVTYKHKCSVLYALDLFEGTTLFNRSLSLKPRESNQVQQDPQTQYPNYLQNQNQNQSLQYGNIMMGLGNYFPNMGINMYNMYPNNAAFMMPNQGGFHQMNAWSNSNTMQNSSNPPSYGNEDRRNNRVHPYYYGNNKKDRDQDRDQDRDRNRDRDRNSRDRDNHDNGQDSRHNSRPHRSKQSYHNSNKHNRRNYR